MTTVLRAGATAGAWVLVVLLVALNPLALLGVIGSWLGLAPDVRTGQFRK